MDELIKKLLQNGLADLEGLHVTGTVPIRQELVNEAIQGFLQDALKPKPVKEKDVAQVADTAAATVKAASKPSLPKEVILGMVKRAEVKMHEGEMRVEFEIRR